MAEARKKYVQIIEEYQDYDVETDIMKYESTKRERNQSRCYFVYFFEKRSNGRTPIQVWIEIKTRLNDSKKREAENNADMKRRK